MPRRAFNHDLSINIHAPFLLVYDRWTQFEAFPHFMRGRHQNNLDEGHMIWRINIGGKRLPWQAQVCNDVPGSVIAWWSFGDQAPPNAGTVRFDAVNNDTTRVTVTFEFNLPGASTPVHDELEAIASRIQCCLMSFREYAESRRSATEASKEVMFLSIHHRV